MRTERFEGRVPSAVRREDLTMEAFIVRDAVPRSRRLLLQREGSDI